jgi:hypothetical protein
MIGTFDPFPRIILRENFGISGLRGSEIQKLKDEGRERYDGLNGTKRRDFEHVDDGAGG